jgi:squalene cyclase
LEKLIIRNEAKGTARVQPCKSPVWDTSLTLKALLIGGLTTSHPAVRKGVQWVRSRHIKQPGDWAVKWKVEGGRRQEAAAGASKTNTVTGKDSTTPPLRGTPPKEGNYGNPSETKGFAQQNSNSPPSEGWHFAKQNDGVVSHSSTPTPTRFPWAYFILLLFLSWTIPYFLLVFFAKFLDPANAALWSGGETAGLIATTTLAIVASCFYFFWKEKQFSPASCLLPPAASLPNGWCFEFNNDFYPDCDDTAMALMVLAGRFDAAGTGQLPPDLRVTAVENAGSLDEAKEHVADVAETTAAVQSGLRWLFGMQNKDGGWAAFDRDNTKEFLCKVPFADHNAMIDPSTPDLTGRVMESLGRLGFRVGEHKEIDRVVKYMRKEQQADGSWFGRWGVNYIYGTWQALTGLTAVGVPADDPAVQSGAQWLLTHQHSTGGWGESPDSYEDPPLRGSGTPTASQTAWAVMGLIAAGKTNDPAVTRGIRFLLDRQRPDGTWFEPEYTGTGFPLVFYLKYH